MQIPVTWKRKLMEAWPTIYQITNGFFSYLLRTGKNIGSDVFSEIFGKH